LHRCFAQSLLLEFLQKWNIIIYFSLEFWRSFFNNIFSILKCDSILECAGNFSISDCLVGKWRRLVFYSMVLAPPKQKQFLYSFNQSWIDEFVNLKALSDTKVPIENTFWISNPKRLLIVINWSPSFQMIQIIFNKCGNFWKTCWIWILESKSFDQIYIFSWVWYL
jgi:hypothetical protein